MLRMPTENENISNPTKEKKQKILHEDFTVQALQPEATGQGSHMHKVWDRVQHEGMSWDELIRVRDRLPADTVSLQCEQDATTGKLTVQETSSFPSETEILNSLSNSEHPDAFMVLAGT